METITNQLQSLTTESRALLEQSEDIIAQEVIRDAITPSQVAWLIAERFTAANVGLSYPILCLIDLLLHHCLPSTDTTDQTLEKEKRAIVFRSTLRELWPLLRSSPGILEAYSTAIEKKSVREKGIRLVRRWQQRQLLSAAMLLDRRHDHTIEEEQGSGTTATGGDARRQAEEVALLEKTLEVILAKMEGTFKPPTSTAAASSTAPSETGAKDAQQPQEDAAATGPAAHGQRAVCGGWTRGEMIRFRRLLKSCLEMLEALPLPRARAYAELLYHAHVRTPTPSSHAVLQNLRHALQAEVDGQAGSDATAGDDREKEPEAGSSTEKAMAEGAETEHRRAALAQLLGSLDAEGRGSAPSSHAGFSVLTPGGSSTSFRSSVTHYGEPLQSDTCLRVPLVQRGNAGYGEFQRRTRSLTSMVSLEPTGGLYYPGSFHRAVAPSADGRDLLTTTSASQPEIRPFRIPPAVLRSRPGGRGRRLPFPTEAMWQKTWDTAQLALYELPGHVQHPAPLRSSEGIGDENDSDDGSWGVSRKRHREDEEVPSH